MSKNAFTAMAFAALVAMSGNAFAQGRPTNGATKIEFEGGFAIVQPDGRSNIVYDSEELRLHSHNGTYNGQNVNFLVQMNTSEGGVEQKSNIVGIFGENQQIFVSNQRTSYGQMTVQGHCTFNAEVLNCIEITNDGSTVDVTHDRLRL